MAAGVALPTSMRASSSGGQCLVMQTNSAAKGLRIGHAANPKPCKLDTLHNV